MDKAKRYRNVLIFFILEVLAFVSFNLANMFILFAMLGVLLLFALVAFGTSKTSKKEKLVSFVIFLAPLIIYALLTMFSKFSLQNNGSILVNLIVAIALLSFVTVGYLSRRIDGFKIKNAMIVIYGGLSLLLLISLIYSMVRYVPFYTVIYDGMYIYYNGERTTVYDSIKLLMGFEFQDMSINYFSIFAVLLFSSVVGLRFINPKKEKKQFLLFLAYALLGFICLLFTINKYRLISDILILILLPVIAFVPKKQAPNWVKMVFYVITGMVSAVAAVFIMNSLHPLGFISGSSLLNKLFNTNHYSRAWKEAIQRTFSNGGIMGYFIGAYEETNLPSSNFIFDTLMTSGLFGTIAIVAFLMFTVSSLIRYFQKSSDTLLEKNLVLAFIASFFVYGLFSLDIEPYKLYSNFIPMYQNPSFLVVLFLIGYSFTSKHYVEEEIVEESKDSETSEVEVEVISDEKF